MATEAQKLVSSDESVTQALINLLNQYPALDGDTFEWGKLSDSAGKSIFPVSGGTFTEKKSVTGMVTRTYLQPLMVVYRASGLSSARKVAVKEWLDNLGRWLDGESVQFMEQTYQLTAYPELGDGMEFASISRTSASFLNDVGENNVEDWVVTITAQYRKKFKRVL